MGGSDSKLAEFKQANADKIAGLEESISKTKKNIQHMKYRISLEETKSSSEILGILKESLKSEEDVLSKAESELVDFKESSKAAEATFVSDLVSIERQFMDELDHFKDFSLKTLSDKVSRRLDMDFCDTQQYINVPINAIYSAKPVIEYITRMIQTSSEKACTNVVRSLDYVNIALIGPQKAWKLALANYVFNQNLEVPTIEGVPTDNEFTLRQSDKCKHLRLYCTKALTKDNSAIDALKEAQAAVRKELTPGYLHAVWYCMPATESLGENGHSDAIKVLLKVLPKVGVPLIIVPTQAKSADFVPLDKEKCGLSDVPSSPVTTNDDNSNSCMASVKKLIELTIENICKSCSLSAPSPFIAKARKDFRSAMSDNLDEQKREIRSEKRCDSAAKKLKDLSASTADKFKSNAVSVLTAEVVAALGDGRKSELTPMISGHLNVMIGNVLKWTRDQIDSVFSDLTSEPLDSAVARIEELLAQFKGKYRLAPNCPWEKEGVDLRQYVLGYKNGAVKKSVEAAFLAELSGYLVKSFAEENATTLDNTFSAELKGKELEKIVDEGVCKALKNIPNEHRKETASGIWKLF